MGRTRGLHRSVAVTKCGIVLEEDVCRPFHNARSCSDCLRACPSGVFLSLPMPLPLRPGSPIDHYEIRIVQPSQCVGCRACAERCPAGAILSGGT